MASDESPDFSRSGVDPSMTAIEEVANLNDTPKKDLLPKGSEKFTELELGGVKVKVKTDATPALLKQTREVVNDLFEAYADRMARGLSAPQLNVLVAYNLAEELLSERERLRVLKKQVAESTDRLQNRIESFLAKN